MLLFSFSLVCRLTQLPSGLSTSLVASIAFRNRFRMTCWICTESTDTGGSPLSKFTSIVMSRNRASASASLATSLTSSSQSRTSFAVSLRRAMDCMRSMTALARCACRSSLSKISGILLKLFESRSRPPACTKSEIAVSG